jgi:hypothetical protein
MIMRPSIWWRLILATLRVAGLLQTFSGGLRESTTRLISINPAGCPDTVCLAVAIATHESKLGMYSWPDGLIKPRIAIFGAEDNVVNEDLDRLSP